MSTSVACLADTEALPDGPGRQKEEWRKGEQGRHLIFPLGYMWGGQGHKGHLEGAKGNWVVLGATDGPKGEAVVSWGQLG